MADGGAIDLLDVRAVSARLRISASTWRAYVARGQAPEPVATVGNSPVWDAAAIARWEQTRRSPLNRISLRPADQRGVPFVELSAHDVARFWSRVHKTDGCWLYGARKNVYPKFRAANGESSAAHRISWMLANGEIPYDQCVCHHCDTPACVRPDHLFLGSHRDNLADAASKGRMRSGTRQRARQPSRKRKVLLAVDAETGALLKQTGNASAYIEQAVRERWRAWQEALSLLRAQGWHREELHAACDALNGLWMIPYEDRVPMGSSIALELYDAQRLNGVAEKHQVAPRVWEARIEQVRTDDRIARALRVVVTEWWSGNAACEAAVARAGEE